MTSPTKRRPLPALVFLLALTLLAALVWWRVLDRDTGHAASPSCDTSSGPAAPKHLPQQAAVTVHVLNSTNRQGIATKAQNVLVRDGFRAPLQADNDGKTYGGTHEIPGVAQIRYGTAGADGAKLLQYYFPRSVLVKTDAKDSTVLVSLGRHFTAVASRAQVKAALKADGITLVAVTGAPDTGEGNCTSSAA